jgi:hypothetical protein
MVVPEIILKKIIDALLVATVSDFNAQSNEQNSFLFRVFYGNVIGTYDYYTQAKALMLNAADSPRSIQTRIFFDRTRAHVPTIHITLPSENHYADGLSMDVNYVAPLFNDTDQTFQEQYSRTFNTRYNIVLTSDNTFEVLIMYYLLKALFVANFVTLENNGLRNFKMSGQDLLINDANMPTNIFMRGLQLDVFYEFTVPEMNATEMLSNFDFIGSVDEVVVQNYELIGEVRYFYANDNPVIAE